jgi:hypothetical protein
MAVPQNFCARIEFLRTLLTKSGEMRPLRLGEGNGEGLRVKRSKKLFLVTLLKPSLSGRGLIYLTHLNQIRQVLGALQPEGLRDSSRWSETTGNNVYECPHPERVPELFNGSR